MQTWTGQASASVGHTWKYFLRGPSDLCVQNILRGHQINAISQWCERARPQRVMQGHGWRTVSPLGSNIAVKLKPSYHSHFWRKFCCDCGRSDLDEIAPNIPIHDTWSSGRIVCPSSASGNFWIFVHVRLNGCISDELPSFSDSTLSKWSTSLLVHKLPLRLSGIISSVRLLTLSQFSLWCGSSKAFCMLR